MKLSRWTDHLPAWLAYGAVATTGIYEAWELVWMAVPVLAGAVVEALRLDLGRWRRWLQAFVVLILVMEIPILRRQSGGLLSIVVHLLFMLMGLRLSLPRELAQRRQLLLMGFLLFLTTAVSTSDLEFMGWALVWVAGASTVLLQQAWERSAALRRGPTPPPPYSRTLRWTLACLVMAGGFFVFLPRITLGLRPLPWSVATFSGSAAGLSESVDLSQTGRISGNSDIVMRIQPPTGMAGSQIPELAERLALLRGVGLEQLDGAHWQPLTHTSETPRRPYETVPSSASPDLEGALQVTLEPSPTTLLALPYGNHLAIQVPRGVPIVGRSGGSLHWDYPSVGRQYLNLFGLKPMPEFRLEEPPPFGQRRAILLFTGGEDAVARRFAEQAAPGELRPKALAQQLTRKLRSFSYTLDNPSGGAKDPIADFLENTRAGHCEYFATSLALMLRSRGVFARVVNGYRLGPWSSEGGYFLVTQNEAHSWVEYYDPDVRYWRVADPTPAAPPNTALTMGFMGAVQRWMDAVRFRWDRHVVRFSGQDQVAGFDWASEKLTALGRSSAWNFGGLKGKGLPSLPASLLIVVFVGALAWVIWRVRGIWMPRVHATGPTGLRPLRPLLWRTRRILPPRQGETLRTWLHRLAQANPERESALKTLAAVAESVAYGGAADQQLKDLVKTELPHWKR